MTTRQDICDALNATELVTATPYRPTALASGQAWTEYALTRAGAGWAFEKSWTVVVLLPTDGRAAAMWWDNNIETLAQALGDVIHVDDVQPGSLAVDTSALLAALLHGRSE